MGVAPGAAVERVRRLLDRTGLVGVPARLAGELPGGPAEVQPFAHLD